jgi:hypothetical protein
LLFETIMHMVPISPSVAGWWRSEVVFLSIEDEAKDEDEVRTPHCPDLGRCDYTLTGSVA